MSILFFQKDANGEVSLVVSPTPEIINPFVTAVYIPTPVKPKTAPRYTYTSCVLFAKALTGFNKAVGRAINWPINSLSPEVGSVVIFKYSHVAVITSVASDSFEVIEANYSPGKVSTRSINFDDKTIKGYYKSAE